MKMLKTIYQRAREREALPRDDYKVIKASRTVIFDEEFKVALLYVGKYDYHKLPGGGIEGNETPIETLKRECLEEVGCEIKNIKELGIIKEYRDNVKEISTSYCYVAVVDGNKGKTSFTDKEIAFGFKLLWVNFEQAIELFENDTTDDQIGKMILQRDLTILKESKNFL
ncbi:MAG TPA: NUDIX domain-containing protein [Candidatus Bipolaricaulota bacterium]|nr:NUDIX domain-containing protein [Candidatus Bipolaricaulota bacterium]